MRGQVGRVHRRGREARALRGRLHLRQERHRHAALRQRRPHRPAPAEARPAAALLHRLLHVHEVVRAAARGVPVPGGHAARALPGRRAHHRLDARSTWSSSSSARSSRCSSRSPAGPTTRTGCRECLARSAKAEDDLVAVLQSAKQRALARSTPTSAPSTTSARSSARSAAPRTRSTTTASCARRSRSASPAQARAGHAGGRDGRRAFPAWWSRGRPTGPASASSGRCSRTRARWRWPPPTPRWAACTTSASATTRPDPLETLADYCLGCYTNLNLPTRIDMLARYLREYQADGFLINSVKSCNSFSAGQLHILREVESAHGAARRLHRERPGRPALLLGRQHQEPARVLLPDARAEARWGRIA